MPELPDTKEALKEWQEARAIHSKAVQELQKAQTREEDAFAALCASRSRGRISHATRREQQVYEGVVAGKSNKEIGAELFISERTVKFHVSSILHKMGFKDRMELMRNFRGIIASQ